MVLMPEFNWKYSYPLIAGGKKYLAVTVGKTPDLLEEDMHGVSVKFKGPSDETIIADIDHYYGLEDNLILLFNKLTPIYTPIGFVEPEDDLASFAEPVWVA